MKKDSTDIKRILIGFLLTACAVLSILSAIFSGRQEDTSRTASRLERRLERKVVRLEKAADQSISGDCQDWLTPKGVSDDMVFYRYLGGELQSWSGSFNIADDKLDGKLNFPIINKSKARRVPGSLSEVSDTLGFHNFGHRWYLAGKKTRNDACVIYGMMVCDPFQNGSRNGVNPSLRLRDKYSVKPLTSEEGSVVKVHGKPLFKLVLENPDSKAGVSPLLIWLSFGFFVIALLLMAVGNRSFSRMLALLAALLTASFVMWLWGRAEMDSSNIFSPTIYADGEIFYSLGAVILINATISLACLLLFLSRNAIYEKPLNKKQLNVFRALGVLLFVAGLFYAHTGFKSIIVNSGICLELYKIQQISIYSAIIYASFILLVAALPLMAALSWEASVKLGSRKFRFGFREVRVAYSALAAVYFVLMSSLLGFDKEKSMMEIWAERISMDRDISLEIALKRAENEIARDSVIASLTLVPSGDLSIENRLSNIYFNRLSRSYNFIVKTNPKDVSEMSSKDPIAPGSHFCYLKNEGAYPIYGGLFFYNIPTVGITSVFIKAEPVSGSRTMGYASLLGITPPGRAVLPPAYSYARYQDRKLIDFNGNFPYKTYLDRALYDKIYTEGTEHLKVEGSRLFIYRISDSEVVLISRPVINKTNYIIETISLAVILYALVSVYSLLRKKRTAGKSYFRSRISWTMMSSLLLSMVVLTFTSVIFVYRKNERNMIATLTDKITGTQSLLQGRVRDAENTADLIFPGLNALLERVAETSNSDIALFSPEGALLMSTSQILYENCFLSNRMDGNAFKNIILSGRRIFFQKESLGNRQYYNMYAPIIGSGGQTLAIIASPYADGNYDFEKDAIAHLVSVVSVFLLLMILARVIIIAWTDRMFGPLGEMSRKMSIGGLDSFELIDYERQDEISDIVDAYNRMVTELAESSRELASAERNKAWSEMARQVAHEVKNPLTPMKLQLQRLIRMKANGSPDWQSKFDEISKVILDHIDILSDTANEFSSFAKLYSEPHTLFNLRELILEEISIFDSKPNVQFEFIGLKDAVVSGPKPQLARVFVNLLGNAVQAIEGNGNGQVIVSLRKSGEAGYYDIVFEDNGPGVDADKEDKLFTPNFTTKNGGSGLGLAISRSILETCGASIAYSRSFKLGGACFTIRYPTDQTR